MNLKVQFEKDVFEVEAPDSISCIELKEALGAKFGAPPSSLCFVLNDLKIANTVIMKSLGAPFTGTIQCVKIPEATMPDLPKFVKKYEIIEAKSEGQTKPSGDPPNFLSMLDFIKNMGFPKHYAKNALRSTNYNIKRAIDLLTGFSSDLESDDFGGPNRSDNEKRYKHRSGKKKKNYRKQSNVENVSNYILPFYDRVMSRRQEKRLQEYVVEQSLAETKYIPQKDKKIVSQKPEQGKEDHSRNIAAVILENSQKMQEKIAHSFQSCLSLQNLNIPSNKKQSTQIPQNSASVNGKTEKDSKQVTKQYEIPSSTQEIRAPALPRAGEIERSPNNWTREEELLLVALWDKYRSNWQLISKILTSHQISSIKHHWTFFLSNVIVNFNHLNDHEASIVRQSKIAPISPQKLQLPLNRSEYESKWKEFQNETKWSSGELQKLQIILSLSRDFEKIARIFPEKSITDIKEAVAQLDASKQESKALPFRLQKSAKIGNDYVGQSIETPPSKTQIPSKMQKPSTPSQVSSIGPPKLVNEYNAKSNSQSKDAKQMESPTPSKDSTIDLPKYLYKYTTNFANPSSQPERDKLLTKPKHNTSSEPKKLEQKSTETINTDRTESSNPALEKPPKSQEQIEEQSTTQHEIPAELPTQTQIPHQTIENNTPQNESTNQDQDHASKQDNSSPQIPAQSQDIESASSQKLLDQPNIDFGIPETEISTHPEKKTDNEAIIRQELLALMKHEKIIKTNYAFSLLNSRIDKQNESTLQAVRARGYILWTTKQDTLLINLWRHFGNKWEKTYAYFPTRPPKSIIGHWKILINQILKDQDLSSAEIKVLKNFNSEQVNEFLAKNDSRKFGNDIPLDPFPPPPPPPEPIKPSKIILPPPVEIPKEKPNYSTRIFPSGKHGWPETDEKLLVALYIQCCGRWTEIASVMTSKSKKTLARYWNTQIRPYIAHVNGLSDEEFAEKLKYDPKCLKNYLEKVSFPTQEVNVPKKIMPLATSQKSNVDVLMEFKLAQIKIVEKNQQMIGLDLQRKMLDLKMKADELKQQEQSLIEREKTLQMQKSTNEPEIMNQDQSSKNANDQANPFKGEKNLSNDNKVNLDENKGTNECKLSKEESPVVVESSLLDSSAKKGKSNESNQEINALIDAPNEDDHIFANDDQNEDSHIFSNDASNENDHVVSNDVKTEDDHIATNDMKTEDDHIATNDVKTEDDHIATNDVKTEDDHIATNEDQTEDDHIATNEDQTEDDHIATNEDQTEDDHIATNDVKTEDDHITTNDDQNEDDHIATNDVKTEDDHIATNKDQNENDHVVSNDDQNEDNRIVTNGDQNEYDSIMSKDDSVNKEE